MRGDGRVCAAARVRRPRLGGRGRTRAGEQERRGRERGLARETPVVPLAGLRGPGMSPWGRGVGAVQPLAPFLRLLVGTSGIFQTIKPLLVTRGNFHCLYPVS